MSKKAIWMWYKSIFINIEIINRLSYVIHENKKKGMLKRQYLIVIVQSKTRLDKH